MIYAISANVEIFEGKDINSKLEGIIMMRDNEIAVSVIVPTYNLEKYIEKCLDSIMEQTLRNIEIILVDDCSTDSTQSIIERYIDKSKTANIVFLKNKSNMGAGYSRNKGMDVARGKYLVFLDGDDFFKPQMLEKLYIKCEENDAEISVCNYYYYNNITQISIVCDNMNNYPMDDFGDGFRLSDINDFAFQFVQGIAWNKMFLHKFVAENNIRFQCQHNANDQLFVFVSMMKANKIVMVEDCLLYYRKNISNQLSVSVSKAPMCIWNATKATLNFMEMNCLYEQYKKSFNSYMVDRIIFSLQAVEISEQEKLLKFYQEKGFELLRIKGCRCEDFISPYFYEKCKWLVNLKSLKELNETSISEFPWNVNTCENFWRQLKQYSRLVLWGIGKNAKIFLEKSNDVGLVMRCIIDRNREKIGQVIQGYTIKGKENLENDDLVIALNPNNIIMIQHQATVQNKKIKILDAKAYLCYGIDFEQATIEIF